MSDSKDFKWTDELVIEYGLQVKSKIDILKDIEAFKASKQPTKDWEIVRLRDKNGNVWESYLHDGTPHFCGGNYDYVIKTKIPFTFDIESVRRISDNLVFKVGDKDGGGRGKIKNFLINDGKMCVSFENNCALYYLNELRKGKPKEPLFTTADMKNIYEGDTYFYVNSNFTVWEIICPIVAPANNKYPETTFSTKETAKQYILENKPISISYKELTQNLLSSRWEDLRKFFKSKIQP